jgi:tight adherence protein C
MSNGETIILLFACLAAAFASIAAFGAWLLWKPHTVLTQRLRSLAPQEVRAKADPHLGTYVPQAFKRVHERLGLEDRKLDSETIQNLRRAGFRGHGAVVVFQSIRAMLPILASTLTFFYLHMVLTINQPMSVELAASFAAGICGWFAPSLYLHNRIQKRRDEIRRAWPNALDLLLICVEAGMGLESALIKVGEEIEAQSKAIAEEFSVLTLELSYLPERRQAYENFARRCDIDSVRATITSLIQADMHGTSLAQTLRVLARESRDMRLAAAEAKAAALPPKLTVPMILFFLPVLFAIILTPAILQIMRLP